MSWTEASVELLKKLWAEGQSCSQIAAQLGGVTRNAVIGKLHRENVLGRAAPVRSRPKRARATVVARKPTLARNLQRAQRQEPKPPKPLPPPPLVPPEARNLGLMELTERTCKFPIGEETGRNQLFCGAAKPEGGSAYCAWHRGLAHSSPTVWRADNHYAVAAE